MRNKVCLMVTLGINITLNLIGYWLIVFDLDPKSSSKYTLHTVMFIFYVLNIFCYFFIWYIVINFFRKHHNETYQQIKVRINTFFVIIEIFLVIRAVIYYILCLTYFDRDTNPGFKMRYIGDFMLYLSEIFLAFFIMHLSLETLKNN